MVVSDSILDIIQLRADTECFVSKRNAGSRQREVAECA
jgi:hypothetical protein